MTGPVSLTGELSAHRLLRFPQGPSGLEEFVAPLVAQDEAGEILVFRGVADHVTLGEAFRRRGIDVEALSSRVGIALGCLHSRAIYGGCLGTARPADNPVQTYGRWTPEMLGQGPRCGGEFLGLLQSEPALNASLRTLRASWRETALIHGDMKADNVITSAGAIAPMIVDWELCGRGDPGWDCGSLLGSLFLLWTESLAPGGMQSSSEEEARRRLYGGIRAFWRAYERQRRRHDGIDFKPEAELEIAFRWAGYWLLQRVAIILPVRRSLTALDVTALHVAASLLIDGTPPLRPDEL